MFIQRTSGENNAIVLTNSESYLLFSSLEYIHRTYKDKDSFSQPELDLIHHTYKQLKEFIDLDKYESWLKNEL